MLQQLPQLLFSGAIKAFEGGRALPEPEVGKPDLKQEISHLVWYVRGGTKNNHNKQGLRRCGEGRGVPGVLLVILLCTNTTVREQTCRRVQRSGVSAAARRRLHFDQPRRML